MASSVDHLLQEAKNLHLARNLAGAEAKYEEALREAPGNAVALYYTGIIAHERGDGGRAIEYVGKASAADTTVPMYAKNLAALNFLSGRYGPARDAFLRYEQLFPQHADGEVPLNLGVCLYKEKRFAEALAAFDRAQAMAPGNPMVYYNQAVVHQDLRDFDRAAAKFGEAIRLAPNLDGARIGLGQAEDKIRARRNLDARYGPLVPAGAGGRPGIREIAESFAFDAGWGNFIDSPSSLKEFEFLLGAGRDLQAQQVVVDISAGQCFNRIFFDHAQYVAIDSTVGDSDWDYSGLDLIGDALNLPLRPDCADVCLNFVSLEHYRDPQRAFREFARALKPGGMLYLAAPFAYPEHQVPHDYFRFTRYGLAHLCQSHGLEVVSISPDRGFYSTALDWLVSAVKGVSDAGFQREVLEYLEKRVRPVFDQVEKSPGYVVDYPQHPAQEQFAYRYDLVARKPGTAADSKRFASRRELVESLAACPACHSGLEFAADGIRCRSCGRAFGRRNGIPDLQAT